MKVSIHLLGTELVALQVERMAGLLEGMGGGAGDDGPVDPEPLQFGFGVDEDEDDRAR